MTIFNPNITMKLVMVEPNEVNVLWTGNPAELPLSAVVDNIPHHDETGEEGYKQVGDASAIHAALIADSGDTVAGWDDDINGDACWFEWRDEDEDSW